MLRGHRCDVPTRLMLREVADDGIEPDVEALGWLVFPPGNWDAPVDVARHGTRADVFEEVLGELDNVRTPGAGLFTIVEPCGQGFGECR